MPQQRSVFPELLVCHVSHLYLSTPCPWQGQNMLMILKKDAMSLLNPLDHSLIHCQPLVHIRVWGVGSSKGR